MTPNGWLVLPNYECLQQDRQQYIMHDLRYYNWRYFKYGPGSKPQPTEHQNRC